MGAPYKDDSLIRDFGPQTRAAGHRHSPYTDLTRIREFAGPIPGTWPQIPPYTESECKAARGGFRAIQKRSMASGPGHSPDQARGPPYLSSAPIDCNPGNSPEFSRTKPGHMNELNVF